MINLRYHIVSIVAVFLALGIGTALGGTLLDRYTVNLLEQGIGNAETRIAETEKENDRLDALNGAAAKRDRALLDVGGDRLLADRLLDVPVLVVTAPGVKSGDTDDLRAALSDAGADVRGTLELRSGLAFTGDVDQGLAEAVGVSPDDAGAVRNTVLGRFHGALADATAPAPEQPSTTTTTIPSDPGTTLPGTPPTEAPPTEVPTTETPATGPPATDVPTDGSSVPGDDSSVQPDVPTPVQPEILTALLAADYVRFSPGPDHVAEEPILETTGYRLVFVAAAGDDPQPNLTVVDLLTRNLAKAPIRAVVTTSGSTAPDALAKTDAVALIRTSDDLADRYSTVDDTATFSGLVATVFALEDLTKPVVGHYGTAGGATAPLPPRG